MHEADTREQALVEYIAKRFKTSRGFAEVLIAVAQYKPEMYPDVVRAVAEFETEAQRAKTVGPEVVETLKRIGYGEKTVENMVSMLRRPDSRWVNKQRYKRLMQRLEDAKLLTDEDWNQLEQFKQKLTQRGYSKQKIARCAVLMFDALVELKKVQSTSGLQPRLVPARRRKRLVDKR